jgi:hypothetical protein
MKETHSALWSYLANSYYRLICKYIYQNIKNFC